jgi:hypothetical protein
MFRVPEAEAEEAMTVGPGGGRGWGPCKPVASNDPRAEKKTCIDCKHYIRGEREVRPDKCAHPKTQEFNVVTGWSPIPARTARIKHELCGVSATHFEAREGWPKWIAGWVVGIAFVAWVVLWW